MAKLGNVFKRGRGSRKEGISPFKAGLIAIILTVVGSYFAYTQANPFADKYEFSAAFHTSNNLAADAPVRIAGVDVGVVTSVERIPGEDGARVWMEMEEEGLPIHEDSELEIRPRIFLEGNEFVDLQPGTPSAPVLDDGETIPVNQTATPVQLGQVLSVLESDTREDLRTLFEEYSFTALKGGGAEGFRDSIPFWEGAYKNSALANDALLGNQTGHLFRLVQGQQQTFDALSSEPEELQGLVTNFNTTAAAFAREDDALQATIPALRDVLAVGRPALQSLNSSFPGIQRFSVDALPGVISSRTTIPETFPFIRQLRLLFQPSELQGLTDDLRRTIPPLVRLNARTRPFLDQARQLSRCTNDVLLPFARTPIPSGDPGPVPAVGPNWMEEGPTFGPEGPDFPFDPQYAANPFMEQGPRGFTGLAGESRTYDGIGKAFRVNFKLDNAATVFRPGAGSFEDEFILLGRGDERSRPAPPPMAPGQVEAYRQPSFRPDFPCELSVPPDLRAPEAGESIANQAEAGDVFESEIPLVPDEPLSVSGAAAASRDEGDLAQQILEDVDPETRRQLEDEGLLDGLETDGASGPSADEGERP